MSSGHLRRVATIACSVSGTLKQVARQLDALGVWHFDPPTDLLAVETVQPGDSLSRFAHRHYDDAELWPDILAANSDTICNEFI